MQDEPVLIEQTAKKWKAFKILGTVLSLGGVGLYAWHLVVNFYVRWEIDHDFDTPTDIEYLFVGAWPFTASVLFVSGIGVLCYARFMAWWRHG